MSGDVGSRHANDDPISWLEQSITKEVLHNSYKIYNNLPPETSLPINEAEHLVHIGKIIWDCKASNKIGVIALHHHETLLPDHSFVGHIEQLNKSYYYWTRKLANERINLDKVCGYKFSYVEGKRLCPFEFRQGQMLDLSGVDKTLFSRIGQYLIKNYLTSRIGLVLLIPELSKNKMTEFSLPCGMVQVETELLPKDQTTVTTEWHWDPRTGLYGAGVYCVINKKGEHEELVTKCEGLSKIVDVVNLAEQAGLLQFEVR
jgi:hypothetical protein